MTSDIPNETSSESSTSDRARPLSGAIMWAAIVILFAFGILVMWMLATAESATNAVWLRQQWIYGSVEAIVFAAAGALFGVQVKREQVAKAEERATSSQAEAEEAKRSERIAASDAERGRAQAAAIRGMAAAAAATGEAVPQGQEDIPRARGAGAVSAAGMSSDAALSALRSVADELFPPVGGGA
jgi:hypothetical protein